MKVNRILSLLVCIAMLACSLVMSGCTGTNSEENSANSGTRKIVTLNMYVVTEDETNPDAARQVQMEINRKLLPEYKTMIKINYVTQDKYWETIDEVTKAVSDYREKTKPDPKAAAEAQTETAAKTEGEPEEVVLESDDAVKGTKDMTFNELIDFVFDSEDITLDKPQLDIFVVNDYEKYCEMAKAGSLAPLNSYYDYESKILTKSIYPTIVNSARVGKEIYGVPTNHKLDGEFTYFVFNKNLLDKHGYKVSELTNYANLGNYLARIKMSEPGVWPMSHAVGVSGAELYDNAFVAISKEFDGVAKSAIPKFMEPTYINNLVATQNYKNAGYIPANYIPGANYAIEVVKTDEILDHEWTKNGITYTAYMYDVPRVTAEDAFKSAMCISSLSTNTARAMEIITLFNTDKELANLLQYGIRGTNYYYEEETDTITMLNDTYSMNKYYTGNTYIQYALDGEENYLEEAVKTNIKFAPSSFLGFIPDLSSVTEKSVYYATKTICENAQKLIDAGADIEETVAIVRKELITLGCVYVDETSLGGVFGKVQDSQSKQAGYISANLGISDEVLAYNDYHKNAQ